MMVGNIWRANIYPNLFISIRDPNRNSEPAFVQSRTFTKAFPKISNTVCTAGTDKIPMAISSCKAKAIPTVFQLMFFLSVLNRNAMSRMDTNPKSPRRIDRILNTN